MPDSTKPKDAREVVKALGTALREDLEKRKKLLKNEKFTPQEAALAVKQAVRDRITDYLEKLVELQKKEGEGSDLSKVTPPDVDEKLIHKLKDQYGHDKEGKAKAYATAWKISNQKGTKKNEDISKSALGDVFKASTDHFVENPATKVKPHEGVGDKHPIPAETKKAEQRLLPSAAHGGDPHDSITHYSKQGVNPPNPGAPSSEHGVGGLKGVPATPSEAGEAGKDLAQRFRSVKSNLPRPGIIRKAIFGLPGKTQSNAQLAREQGPRTVFQILGKQALDINKGTADELKERDSQVKGSVLTGDKPIQKIEIKKTGSGGPIKPEVSIKKPKNYKEGKDHFEKEEVKATDPAGNHGSGGEVRPERKAKLSNYKEDGYVYAKGEEGCDKGKELDLHPSGSGRAIPLKNDTPTGSALKPEKDTNVKKWAETDSKARESMAGDINKVPYEQNKKAEEKSDKGKKLDLHPSGSGRAIPLKNDTPSGSALKPEKGKIAKGAMSMNPAPATFAQPSMTKTPAMPALSQTGQSKNMKMPGAQQSMKMPSQNAQYKEFMPRGKWNKSELAKDMSKIDSYYTKKNGNGTPPLAMSEKDKP